MKAKDFKQTVGEKGTDHAVLFTNRKGNILRSQLTVNSCASLKDYAENLTRDDRMDRSEKKKTKHFETEQPIPSRIYPVIDTDLARDNLENDIPSADLEKFQETSRSGSRRIDG